MSADRSGPKVACRLQLEFRSHEEAVKVHSSVALDNEGYAKTRVDGNSIVAEIDASSLNSLLHTLEDLLSCTSVAEKIVTKKA